MGGKKLMLRKGLTLLELLITVGIVLALASLIIGLVRIGLNVARRTQCANNLRQIYLATKLYEEQFGSPPFFPKHFVTWKPEFAPMLICPSDPYQGRLFEGSYAPETFVPYSYFLNYWIFYHIVHLPRENIRGPKELTDQMLKRWRHELIASDGHWFVCPFHELAVFPDGKIGQARRYTKHDFERPENQF